MKLFGTHVYSKNKYLTLQLTRSSKGVMCEDIFESLVSLVNFISISLFCSCLYGYVGPFCQNLVMFSGDRLTGHSGYVILYLYCTNPVKVPHLCTATGPLPSISCLYLT